MSWGSSHSCVNRSFVALHVQSSLQQSPHPHPLHTGNGPHEKDNHSLGQQMSEHDVETEDCPPELSASCEWSFKGTSFQ
eukprot:5219308-Amphidinium_carterae.2